jgi:hypothetical protein
MIPLDLPEVDGVALIPHFNDIDEQLMTWGSAGPEFPQETVRRRLTIEAKFG